VLTTFEKSRSEAGDVALNTIEVNGGGGARLVIEGRGDVISSSGWNATHAVPADPVGKRSGGVLLWLSPPGDDDVPLPKQPPASLDLSNSAEGAAADRALLVAAPPQRRDVDSVENERRSFGARDACEHTVSLRGPLLVIANWFPGNFHHFLHDTVPVLLFVAKFRAGPSARFGLIDHPLHRRMLGWLAPDLAKRVEWLPHRSPRPVMICFTDGREGGGGSPEEAEAAKALAVASGAVPQAWYGHGHGPALVAVQFKSGVKPKPAKSAANTPANANAAAAAIAAAMAVPRGPRLTAEVDSASVFNLRNPHLSRLMALEVARLKPKAAPVSAPHELGPGFEGSIARTPPSRGGSVGSGGGNASLAAAGRQRSIVFYRRHSNGTQHGRTMDLAHEAILYKTIVSVMAEFKRPEKLVIFNGEDAHGNQLSFPQQYGVFRDASLVIGPHGAGLANLVWMPPSTTSCSQGPAVLEFICSKETATVQKGCPGKTHWSLLGGMPWVRYYHLLLAKNSTEAPGHLWVEPDELAAALRGIFQGQRHQFVPFPPSVDATSILGSTTDPLPMLVPAVSLPSADEVPYFFHVPKAAGTSIERILSTKRKMKTLPAGDLEDLTYVERSQALKRNIISYVKTPLFYEACAMLRRSNLRARAFTVVREPIGRIVSLFWYKKDSTWEKSYDPKYRNQSMEIFLKVPSALRLAVSILRVAFSIIPAREHIPWFQRVACLILTRPLPPIITILPLIFAGCGARLARLHSCFSRGAPRLLRSVPRGRRGHIRRGALRASRAPGSGVHG